MKLPGKPTIIAIVTAIALVSFIALASAMGAIIVTSTVTTTSSMEITTSASNSMTGVPSTITTTALSSFVTSSPPTGQWMILNDSNITLAVSANNTGTIPEYSSLQALNQTVIGETCNSTDANGACVKWQNNTQTGWYLDTSNHLLYIHYLGGRAVKLSVETSSIVLSTITTHTTTLRVTKLSTFFIIGVTIILVVASALIFLTISRRRKLSLWRLLTSSFGRHR